MFGLLLLVNVFFSTGITETIHGDLFSPQVLASAKVNAAVLEDGFDCSKTFTNTIQIISLLSIPDETADQKIIEAVLGINKIYKNSSNDSSVYVVPHYTMNDDCTLNIKQFLMPIERMTFKEINLFYAQNFKDQNKKYLFFIDKDTIDGNCGISRMYLDDNKVINASNKSTFAISSCNYSAFVAAHELTHMLGAVQFSAPHSTKFGHCYDGYDLMCYQESDAAPALLRICPTGFETLDCNNDDYFSVKAPEPNNYLFNHWNIADSLFVDRRILTAPTGIEPNPEPKIYYYLPMVYNN